jgi:hypothetical protein
VLHQILSLVPRRHALTQATLQAALARTFIKIGPAHGIVIEVSSITKPAAADVSR